MPTRPTDEWRRRVDEEATAMADGSLPAEKAYAHRLWPEQLITDTEVVLTAFEADVRALAAPDDKQVFEVVQRVVEALNEVNYRQTGTGIETGEREELCLYIDDSLTDAGVDVAALTARHGMPRHELTDEWRDW
ncbi:hypothetical protein AB0M79_33945 [Polymorphospora sp. NPDC051019]|uniref:hypothetical protein n=1 Tax=Polymorphospora sp. NPDC051019 TaxID=3155725 RepID=UPI0034389B7A